MPEEEANKYLPDDTLISYWLNFFKRVKYYDI